MNEVSHVSGLEAAIEALLFASENPLTFADLLQLLNGESDRQTLPESTPVTCWTEADIQSALQRLQERYATEDSRGFYLIEVAGGCQLRTKPELAVYVQRLHKEKPHRLSRSSMETLSVIAYHQPVPRSAVEEIRGVDSTSALRTLLDRGLIRIIGRSEDVGHPVLYGTAPYFLEVFNLKDLESLPPLESLESLRQMLEDEMGAAASGERPGTGDRGEEEPDALAAVTTLEHFVEEAEMDKALIADLEAEISKLASVQEEVVSTVFQPVPPLSAGEQATTSQG